jgi:hypothetical protein
VSHSCACIESPCLRHCGHGAPIGVPETSTPSADAAAEGRVEAEEEQLEQWEVHKGSFVYANAEQEGEPIGRLDPTHNEDHEVRLTGSRHPPGSG